MPKPSSLKTRIFLDGSDVSETQAMKDTLGFIDGQTTNPSNFVQALQQQHGQRNPRFSEEALLAHYKARVQEIAALVSDGSVSIEVYADANTSAATMIAQGKEMFSWIPNAHVKLPITSAGLEAAHVLVRDGVRVNMTLCFTQTQAAAVYAATKGARRGDVFVSPFIGRVIDNGMNGFDLIRNIVRMYAHGDGHVEVLAASIRNAAQLAEAIALGADCTTSYWRAIREWAMLGMPTHSIEPPAEDLRPIAYQTLSLEESWQSYAIADPMTEDGLRRFAADWQRLLSE